MRNSAQVPHTPSFSIVRKYTTSQFCNRTSHLNTDTRREVGSFDFYARTPQRKEKKSPPPPSAEELDGSDPHGECNFSSAFVLGIIISASPPFEVVYHYFRYEKIPLPHISSQECRGVMLMDDDDIYIFGACPPDREREGGRHAQQKRKSFPHTHTP